MKCTRKKPRVIRAVKKHEEGLFFIFIEHEWFLLFRLDSSNATRSERTYFDDQIQGQAVKRANLNILIIL